MTKRLIFQLLLVLILLSSFTNKSYSQIKFRIVDKQLPVVSVTINGLGKFDFLLDTGSTSTVVTPEVPRQLNIRPAFQTQMITPAGDRMIPGSYLDTVSLGQGATRHVEVLITDLLALQALDKNISGVLGQNFLARFSYLLDFDNEKITFDQNGELEGHLRGTQIPIEDDDEKRLFVKVRTKSGSVRFVLDSGATELILFDNGPSMFGFDQSDLSPATLSTINGNSAVKFVRLNSFHVGDEIFYNLPVIVASRNSERSEDGLMPLGLFRKVYLNHKKEYVIFNPKL